MIKLIGFDADDTLWHNENHFQEMQAALRAIICKYSVEESRIDDHLLQVERKNLTRYGYGAKGFALSMIETALDLTGQRVSGADIARVMAMVQHFMSGPTVVLDGVVETLSALKGKYQLIMITKGDEMEQRIKLTKSDLRKFFHSVRFVLEKNVETYTAILNDANIKPKEFLMIGNSMRSDVLPVIKLGASAVHIPYDVTWKHEDVEMSKGNEQFVTVLPSVRDLLTYLEVNPGRGR